MPLYDPIAAPKLSRAEFDYNSLTRPTGIGEYLSSALPQGWDVSGLGAFVRDPFGASARFGPLPDQPLETSREMGFDVDTPRLTEDQWKKAGLARDGLAYEGGTLDHERSRTDEFDRKRYHESVVARHQGNLATYALGFGARVLGGALSPENFIPFVGPGMRAAMVARLGVIGGHAAVGAVDNVIGTALADAYVMPQMAREGETVTAGDFAMDLVLGAAAGSVLGSAGGWIERRRAAANAIRSPGVESMADALDRAVEAIDTGEPVDVGGIVRSTDVVQRLERNAVDMVDGADLPDLRVAAGREARVAVQTAIETTRTELAAAETSGVDPVPLQQHLAGLEMRAAEMDAAAPTETKTRVTVGGEERPDIAARVLDEQARAREAPETIGRTEFVAGHEVDGRLDLPKAAAALADRVARALGEGDRVTLVVDGKPVPITRVVNGMMTDARGQRWGTASLAASAGPENSVRIERNPRQPDLTTTATPEPSEPSVVAAEKTYKVAPPDFTAEQTARMKESGLDAETMGRDQAAVQQAKKQGALTAAQETELETASATAKQHMDEADAYQSLALCAQRYD